jgi:hypothetical protein
MSIYRWIASSVGSFLVAVTLASHGSSQGSVRAGSSVSQRTIYSVTVASYNGSHSKKLVVHIKDNRSAITKSVVLNDRIASVANIQLTQDKAILVGPLGRGNAITVIDLSQGKIVNTVFCYDYKLSPNNERLIWASYYGPMELPEFRRSICLVYDLGKDPDWYIRYGRDGTINVGIPVFPAANAITHSDDPLLDEKYIYMSPFLWSSESDRIVMVVHRPASGSNMLVAIKFEQKDITRSTIDMRNIDIDLIAEHDKMLPQTRLEYALRPYKLAVEEIKWAGPNEVEIIPYRQYWLPLSFRIKLP